MENQILLDYIGQSKTQNLIDDVTKIFKEKLNHSFPNYFQNNMSKICSLVTVTEKDEIKSIGMSCINDLLTDNYGLWFMGVIGASGTTISAKQTGGISRTLRMWSGGDTFNITNNGAVGSAIRVGTGVTPATRQDVNIETLEQSLVSGNGGYNSGLGKIDIPASAISITTFSLSETALFGVWNSFAVGVEDFLLSRDNISPVVSVIPAQTINVDYSLVLS